MSESSGDRVNNLYNLLYNNICDGLYDFYLTEYQLSHDPRTTYPSSKEATFNKIRPIIESKLKNLLIDLKIVEPY